MAEAIHAALSLPVEERCLRMQRMRRHIRRRNVHAWAESFLRAGLDTPSKVQASKEKEIVSGEGYAAEVAVHGMVRRPEQRPDPRAIDTST
jgi:hypothetical protein